MNSTDEVLRQRLQEAAAWATYASSEEPFTDGTIIKSSIRSVICGKLKQDYGYPVPSLSVFAKPKTRTDSKFTNGCMDPAGDTTFGDLLNAIQNTL